MTSGDFIEKDRAGPLGDFTLTDPVRLQRPNGLVEMPTFLHIRTNDQAEGIR